MSAALGWYLNVRYVYTSSVFDRADELLQAAVNACKGQATCVKRVGFMESGSQHGRLIANALNATARVNNIAGRGANRTALSTVLAAASALTKYRQGIVASGSVNVGGPAVCQQSFNFIAHSRLRVFFRSCGRSTTK